MIAIMNKTSIVLDLNSTHFKSKIDHKLMDDSESQNPGSFTHDIKSVGGGVPPY